mgnify:CR=1 FL=1
MHRIEHDIIDLLSRRRKQSLSRREIADHLDLRGGERKLLTKILDQMVHEGCLSDRRGRYSLLTRPKRTLEGTFSQADKGYGFLRPDDATQEDLFIPARHIGNAMDGDRILGELNESPRDRRPYAKVLKVLDRAHRRLLGTYQPNNRSALVFPLDRKLGGPVKVAIDPDVTADDIVEVELEHYAQSGAYASGKITEIIGPENDPQVDIETVIRSHALPRDFTAAALAEADSVETEVTSADIDGRIDLRSLPLVTIDGETAKDFDDAVALLKEADSYRLWVAIADVSHYVKPEAALDLDARERGTSVYFPGYCLPMLPERLSNGICSLNPAQDRLVMTAELLFSADGTRLSAEFYPAVICSRSRLTYTKVAACLADPDWDALDHELVTQLRQMGELAALLTAKRKVRGSLDLDLPEVEILLDEKGAPYDLVKVERNQAHRLIEEFMLAANEAVAEHLTAGEWPLLYRVHEQPDPEKLHELQQLAAGCGAGLNLTGNLQLNLQRLLAETAEKPEARLINQQLLRSLKQAHYTPDNCGHFGLAADCYCHFTSPIRRYPDLHVHRVLKLALEQKTKKESLSKRQLKRLGEECSASERRALEAERELTELRRCQLMRDHVGEELDGIISSVTEFGFFVELDDLFVEGLVHIRTLRGDYYHFEPTSMLLVGERRRQVFRVGMRVRIKVEQVELWRRRIDFSLIKVEDA